MNDKVITDALELLNQVLEAQGAPAYEPVICGGASLVMLGLVNRVTRDVDIVATRHPDSGLLDPLPMPPPILDAAAVVRDALGLPEDWLNAKVAEGELVRLGLPEGFSTRLHRRRIGSRLTVWLVDRVDLIALKLHAAADHGGGRHLQDLRSLKPSDDELLFAARWAFTQDPSEGFKFNLCTLLSETGHDAVARQL